VIKSVNANRETNHRPYSYTLLLSSFLLANRRRIIEGFSNHRKGREVVFEPPSGFVKGASGSSSSGSASSSASSSTTSTPAKKKTKTKKKGESAAKKAKGDKATKSATKKAKRGD
jgi:hypothetical protein